METSNDTSTNSSEHLDRNFEEDLMKEQYQREVTFKVFLELFTVLSLVCIAINLILCYVIVKYRRLRRNKSNVILMHWTVLNTLFMLCCPTSLRIGMEHQWLYFEAYHVFCVLEQIELTLLLGNLLMIVLLLMSWYLKLYYPASGQKLERNVVFFVAIVYVVVAFSVGLHVHSCFNIYYTYSEVFLGLTYLVFIVFMVVMNVVHLVKRRKLLNTSGVTNTPLVLANTYFLSTVPLLLSLLLQLERGIPPLVVVVLVLGSMMLAVLNSIYFFVILYKFDRDFNTFLSHVFTCKCKSYSEDELAEEPVVYNGSGQNVEM